MTFKLTILGSSSAIPTSKRYPTAQILNVSERFFLIDCGEGTQIQLRKFNIKFSRIDNIFISHVHGDHVFGLFGMLSTFNLLGRKKPLSIHGSAELIPIINFFKQQFADELDYEINVNVIKERRKIKIFEDKVVEVYAFPLKHRVNTFGFLFREKERLRNMKKDVLKAKAISYKDIISLKEGKDVEKEDGTILSSSELTTEPIPSRSYAYCSDTAYYESLIENIKDVDLLFHEATFLESEKQIAKQTGHSTAKQAAIIAKKANAKKLILGHFSARYSEVQIFENEAKEEFLNTIAVNDGDCFLV